MSVMNLAKHLDSLRHKYNRALPAGIDRVRFICCLCHDSPFGDKQWLCEHVDSPVHRHNIADKLMRFWGRRDRLLYFAPEEIERQIELATERVSAHLRLLHWVLDGNKLDEFYYDCLS